MEILDGLNKGEKIVAEGTKKVRPNLTIRPIEKGAKKKQGNSGWGKKNKSKKAETKKGKFDWLKNVFKKSYFKHPKNKYAENNNELINFLINE